MKLFGDCLVFLAGALTVAQLVTLGPNLPDPVVSNFSLDGAPRGRLSRSDFLWLHGLLQFSTALLLVNHHQANSKTETPEAN